MPISNTQWRMEIGHFSDTSEARFFKKKPLQSADPIHLIFSFGFRFVFIMLILLARGEIKLNPVPKKRNHCYHYSMCYWK